MAGRSKTVFEHCFSCIRSRWLRSQAYENESLLYQGSSRKFSAHGQSFTSDYNPHSSFIPSRYFSRLVRSPSTQSAPLSHNNSILISNPRNHAPHSSLVAQTFNFSKFEIRSFSTSTPVVSSVSQTGISSNSVTIHDLSMEHSRLAFLSKLRERLGITKQKLQVMGHCAALFGVVALFMKDMLYLRTFLVFGNCCGIMFNLLQPTPLHIPASWGVLLVILNLFQIGVLIHERREIDFKDEEAEIYDMLFQRHGVSPHQFEKLMNHAGATWQDLPPSHIILKEGDFVETVSIIVRGRAEVSKGGNVVGQMIKGSLIGETSLNHPSHRTGHTVITSESTRILSWPRHRLVQILSEDKNLSLCTANIINSDLVTKLESSSNLSSHSAIIRNYEEVLMAVCADGVIPPAEKRALREFREKYSISNEQLVTKDGKFMRFQHLLALSKAGWSVVEFEDGAKLHVIITSDPPLTTKCALGKDSKSKEELKPKETSMHSEAAGSMFSSLGSNNNPKPAVSPP